MSNVLLMNCPRWALNRSELTIYRVLLRPILFRLGRGDAETAHERTLHLLALLSRSHPLCRTLQLID